MNRTEACDLLRDHLSSWQSRSYQELANQVGESHQSVVKETGGAGVMVAEPNVFGRVYLHDPHQEEDLLFVARAQ